jgi:hypothetical protein
MSSQIIASSRFSGADASALSSAAGEADVEFGDLALGQCVDLYGGKRRRL